MLPGPDIIIECPHCKAVACKSSLASGNTFGATHWSDGKVEAPMLPEEPEISRCQNCNNLYWVKDAKVIGEYDWFGSEDEAPEEWKGAPSISELDIVEYKTALDQQLGGGKEREKYLRIRLWWALNDLVRNEEKQVDLFQEHERLFLENLELLSTLLKNSDIAGQIMRAEIAREMGEFDTCLVRLTVILEKYDSVCDQLKQFIQQKSRIVQELQM